MGLLDLVFGNAAKKSARLRAKVTQKYGDPTTRQKAITQLGEMKTAEAAAVLLQRFTISVEPQTTDADEKEEVFELLKDMGQTSAPAVRAFLRKSEQASSWALRLLDTLLPTTESTQVALDELSHLASGYTRNPEKKLVLIHFVQARTDPRIPDALLPFLDDHADDVKIAALSALGPLKHAPAREPILALLTNTETARRVQVAAVAALQASGFAVQGYRERVEALLQDPFFVDRSGLVQKRA
ncbi:MAG: HEAT repeat domain-containing protein [Myxococcaceae bacterium]